MMDSFGITNDDHVVVYGKKGCVFTPRTFFLFRSMGHDPARVHLMQGKSATYTYCCYGISFIDRGPWLETISADPFAFCALIPTVTCRIV